MIERKGAASKILTVCDYKRVDEMEGDGGKIEVVLVILIVVLVIQREKNPSSKVALLSGNF